MPDKSYPEGVTEMDHVNHDMKMGRFPNQSSVETFLKGRAMLAAQDSVAHLPDLGGGTSDPAFGKWLPIETAPQDGSEFLAGSDRVADGFQQVVFWDDDAAVHGWGTKDSDAICPFGFFTHWMPLPPPPSPFGAPSIG